MKILFMGTPEFAVPTLRELIKNHTVVAVVTQPDKPKGRGKKVQFSPVKEFALQNGIRILQPTKIKSCIQEFKSELEDLSADVFVVAAYGQVLPEAILNVPPKGCLNVHGSLLPQYRGAAPIQWAIINGEDLTGITIMQMDKGLDTGDMLLKKHLPILPEDTAGSLHDKMGELGASALIEALEIMKTDKLTPCKQDSSKASYAPMLNKDMGHINWNRPRQEIINLIRGLDPWPGAFSYYKSEILKIWKAESIVDYEDKNPGEISINNGLIVNASDGALLITEVQAKGGKRMGSANYLRGHKLEEKSVLN